MESTSIFKSALHEELPSPTVDDVRNGRICRNSSYSSEHEEEEDASPGDGSGPFLLLIGVDIAASGMFSSSSDDKFSKNDDKSLRSSDLSFFELPGGDGK
jgi:hypothetical protein